MTIVLLLRHIGHCLPLSVTKTIVTAPVSSTPDNCNYLFFKYCLSRSHIITTCSKLFRKGCDCDSISTSFYPATKVSYLVSSLGYVLLLTRYIPVSNHRIYTLIAYSCKKTCPFSII